MAEDHNHDRLISLFLLAVVLFNYPVLSLFSRPVMVFGFPLLYFYIFFIWAVLILLVGLITASHADAGQPEGDDGIKRGKPCGLITNSTSSRE
ncbi:MAG: hypothetical protein RBT11_06740 [Desulfobacterales bacterium]|jgi:hypothetical protein|nr:hypothetical protein [Desulfobacterales bacterium]